MAAVVKKDRISIGIFRWGLIPPWAKDEKTGYKMINARAETLIEKPSFKKAFQKRRCLVIADGFYEWRGEGKLKKPYYFHLKNRAPMGFAGLYESWNGPEERVVNSCTIITTEPNSLMRPIHHRMPVIISRNNYRNWLNNDDFDAKSLLYMLGPYPSTDMDCYQVSPLVNSPQNNSSQCIQPI